MRILLTLLAQLLHFIAEILEELPHLCLHGEIFRELLFATGILIVYFSNYWKRRKIEFQAHRLFRYNIQQPRPKCWGDLAPNLEVGPWNNVYLYVWRSKSWRNFEDVLFDGGALIVVYNYFFDDDQ